MWLGETPLARVEWQLAPSCSQAGTPTGYENIGTTALCLRLVGPCPTERQLDDAAPLLAALFRPASRGGGALGMDGEGWLLWSFAGPREMFLQAVGLRDRLAENLPALQRAVVLTTRVRWGIWVDDCVVPTADAPARLCIDGTLAKRLFDFEPDNLHGRIIAGLGGSRLERADAAHVAQVEVEERIVWHVAQCGTGIGGPFCAPIDKIVPRGVV